MTVEKTQLKFAKSDQTGELIGFVSRHSITKKLIGVREESRFGKQICLLSVELKGRIEPNKLYSVYLKPMHHRSGYVVVAAELMLFPAQVETLIISKAVYQVTVRFGNKTIFFDPLEGRSASSRTLTGVVKILRERDDIETLESVIVDFIQQATALVERLLHDGYTVPEFVLRWNVTLAELQQAGLTPLKEVIHWGNGGWGEISANYSEK